jgi:CheY-like chemotaxis protein
MTTDVPSGFRERSLALNLLLIDDDAGVRALARTYAELAGCVSVCEAADGETALEFAADQPFDAAVVDFHMPGIDGLETTRRLIAAQPEVDVIAWTSVLDPDVEQSFVQAGARCHITKTDTAALREQLEQLCA